MIKTAVVVLLKVPQNSNEFLKKAVLRLDANSQQKYLKNIDKTRTQTSVYAHLLVRLVATKVLGIKNSDLTFNIDKHGKPTLKNAPDFFFNISHSENLVACAFSNKNIGVDIEKISAEKPRISNKYFTLAEKVYLSGTQGSDDKTNNRFYEIWTKKEAYVKYIGKGLGFGIDSFDVFSKELSGKFFYNEPDGFSLSVFCPQNAKDTYVLNLDFNEFSKQILENLDIIETYNNI